MKDLRSELMILAVCALLVGCGGAGTSPIAITESLKPNAYITVSSSTASLEHSLPDRPSTAQFTAVVHNATDSTVTWLVADADTGSTSGVGSITDTGLYTAPACGQPAKIRITASLRSLPAVIGAANLQLACAVNVSVSAPEGTETIVNRRLPLVADVQNSCNMRDTVAWKLNGNNPGNSNMGLIVPDANVLNAWYYPPQSVPDIPLVITATAASRVDRSVSIQVKVNSQTGEILTVSPSTSTLQMGESQQFKAYLGGTETAATWRVNFSDNIDARVGWLRGSTYNAPYSMPQNNQVVITAADTSTIPPRFASALVTIKSPETLVSNRLKAGSYAGLLVGSSSFAMATLTFDANGNVTGSGEVGYLSDFTRTIKGTLSGTYQESDGEGTLSLRLPDGGVEEWQFNVITPDKIDMSELPSARLQRCLSLSNFRGSRNQ